MMKPIPLTFNKNGFEYSQLSRIGDVAIYEQRNALENRIWYEVVIIQKNQERVIGGATIPAGESMPGNEAWGSKGFTFHDLTAAQFKQAVLVEMADNRKNGVTQL